MPERLLLVEDDAELRGTLEEILADAGYLVTTAANGAEAVRLLSTGLGVDLVVTDLVMPILDGHRLLEETKTARPELDVVVMTAFGTIESAIQMLKAGAADYLTKPVASADLLRVVRGTLDAGRGRRDAAEASRVDAGSAAAGFVGSSPPMMELYRLIARAAGSRHGVLLQGESGTGKELAAHALHRLSGRTSFVAVNCGALPEHLMESELFGHEKGAFSGADRAKPGLFEAADGGTLFLDEIGELPLPLQPKLLRALESGEIRRVGATRPVVVDVRLVAATNRDLEAECAQGRFRQDLFWRLNVLTIRLPPLRERPEDIPGLVEHFLAGQAMTVDPDAMRLLAAYPWPGNVRELRNTVQRAALLTTRPTLVATDLPERIVGHRARPGGGRDDAGQLLSLRELERSYILEVLREVQGNRTRAAEILGVDRKTLYRKLAEYPEPNH
jgi:two-component system response regulator AtoC